LQDVYVKLNPGLPWQSSIQQEDSFSQQIGLISKEETRKCYIWNIALFGAETWTLQKVNHKHLGSLEM
jgi:hypothetical protein